MKAAYIGIDLLYPALTALRETGAEILKIFDGWCCEMEGASIAQVAHINRIPWLIIRAISDRADGTAAETYDKFQDEAIKHFLRLTLAMVKRL